MVNMKYTKFVISAIKERIFGKPNPNVEIPIKGKLKDKKKLKIKKRKSDAIKWPKIKIKNISSITGIIMPIVMLGVGLTVFSSISSALNTVALGPGIGPMMNIIPLILVAGVVIGLITTVFRITS